MRVEDLEVSSSGACIPAIKKNVDKNEGCQIIFSAGNASNVEDREPAADGRSWRSLAFAVKAGAARQACAMHMNYSFFNACGSCM